MEIFKNISEFIENLNEDEISSERKSILDQIINFIELKIDDKEIIALNFICTHNSRRSHLGQIWAQTMATYYNVPNVNSFSGGTEATAVYPQIISTIVKCGFVIENLSENGNTNPIYALKYSDNILPILAFSKKYSDEINPQTNFAAILTCSQADGDCPIIAGAVKRIPLTYIDPKFSDGSLEQEQVYAETCKKIATEMKYVFSKVV